MDIRYTHHARERMIQRGISESEVEKAIARGGKTRRGNEIIVSYEYFNVIYVKSRGSIRVKTVTLKD